MITLSDVSVSHGARTLLDGVTLQLVRGDRTALVGGNGAGKTTLLEIAAGLRIPDRGAVTQAKGTTVGMLRQEVAALSGRPVIDEVVEAAGVKELEARLRELEERIAAGGPGPAQDALVAEHGRLHDRFEHQGGYRVEADARRVLAGLGFSEARMEGDLAELSGGWMMRVALARLLLSRPDVLLLDEPTNHLDLISVEWLESFLDGYEGAVLIVSHDRDFINALATRVVELVDGRTVEYVGDYEAFVEQREARLSRLRAAASNQQRQIAETERFIARFRYKARLAGRVQSRVKALERLERVDAPRSTAPTLRFRFPDPPRGGREVVTLQGATKRFGDHVVYEDLDLVLERGQKVALVGPNGAGKSTLLKILAGVLPLDAGTRRLGHNVEVGYYAQHQVDELNLDRTVLAELTASLDAAAAQRVRPRDLLGAFLFRGDDVDKRVGVLSGGEKSRLALAKLLAAPRNLLCLDEPTNHLDIPSRDVVEDALLAYPATIVFVTHDRHLIRSVADTIVEVADRSATLHPGDFESYVASRSADALRAGTPPETTAPAPEATRANGGRDSQRKRAEAERRNRLYQRTKEIRLRLAAVEEDLGAAEAEVADLTRQLADPAVYADPERVKDLVRRHNEAKDRAVSLTREWEGLYEAVEEATREAAG